MKQNFTIEQINLVKNAVSSYNVEVSFNRSGNINVAVNNHPRKLQWTFYTYSDGRVVIRRKALSSYWLPYGHNHWSIHPLNMIGRKKTNNWGYRPFDFDNSKFNSLDSAIEYFINYLNRNYSTYKIAA